jgi:hypothetical protein
VGFGNWKLNFGIGTGSEAAGPAGRLDPAVRACLDVDHFVVCPDTASMLSLKASRGPRISLLHQVERHARHEEDDVVGIDATGMDTVDSFVVT